MTVVGVMEPRYWASNTLSSSVSAGPWLSLVPELTSSLLPELNSGLLPELTCLVPELIFSLVLGLIPDVVGGILPGQLNEQNPSCSHDRGRVTSGDGMLDFIGTTGFSEIQYTPLWEGATRRTRMPFQLSFYHYE